MDVHQKERAWLQLVREALQPGAPVPADQLLLVRDHAGNNYRPSGPPQGVVARTSAVLLLLYPDGGDLRLPLTVRSDALPNHRGEVSLPGGATDPSDPNAAYTALRECWEELGIPLASINVLGTLTPIYIPVSNFELTPVVGWLSEPPQVQFNAAEVSAVITVTLRALLDPASVVVEDWELRGAQVRVPFFALSGHKVWGATALVLSEFVARLRRASNATRT